MEVGVLEGHVAGQEPVLQLGLPTESTMSMAEPVEHLKERGIPTSCT